MRNTCLEVTNISDIPFIIYCENNLYLLPERKTIIMMNPKENSWIMKNCFIGRNKNLSIYFDDFRYESIFIQLRDRALMRHITSLQLDINFSEGLNFSIRNFSSASDNPLAVARSSISPVFIELIMWVSILNRITIDSNRIFYG